MNQLLIWAIALHLLSFSNKIYNKQIYFVFFQDCGISTIGRPEIRIVGGKNTAFGKYPWQVSKRRKYLSKLLYESMSSIMIQNDSITKERIRFSDSSFQMFHFFGQYCF